jgi:hypothetical protein
VGFGWPVLPDVRRKRDIVSSEDGQESRRSNMVRPYIEGCHSDVCTTIWFCDPVVSNLSMIRPTECSETLSETAWIRTPGMFVALFRSDAFADRAASRRSAHRKSGISGIVFQREFYQPPDFSEYGSINVKRAGGCLPQNLREIPRQRCWTQG